jgi:hypothetical protein
MIVGGVLELFFGVKAERMGLESIARPLTAVNSAVRKKASGARAAAGSVARTPHPVTE